MLREVAGVGMAGCGSVVVDASPAVVWSALLDPGVLAAVVPGATRVARVGPARFEAEVGFGVGPVRGRYRAGLDLAVMTPPERLELAGQSVGRFGGGRAHAWVGLAAVPGGGTRIEWRYEGRVHGPVAIVGRTLLQATGGAFVRRFFDRFGRYVAPPEDGRPLDTC